MTDDAAAFGELRACRQSTGLSQEELAERCGLSIRAISNPKRGRTRWPHPDSVRRLADALRLRGEARGDFLATADRRLLRSPTASAAAVSDGHQARAGGGQIVPRQLPGPVRQFVGRDSEIAALTGLLDSAGSRPAAPVISASGGTAGVGKTALAIHLAHQAAGSSRTASCMSTCAAMTRMSRYQLAAAGTERHYALKVTQFPFCRWGTYIDLE